MNVTPRHFVYAAMLVVALVASSWVMMWDSAPDSHDVIWLNVYASETH